MCVLKWGLFSSIYCLKTTCLEGNYGVFSRKIGGTEYYTALYLISGHCVYVFVYVVCNLCVCFSSKIF
jgi:hypothetical protein